MFERNVRSRDLFCCCWCWLVGVVVFVVLFGVCVDFFVFELRSWFAVVGLSCAAKKLEDVCVCFLWGSFFGVFWSLATEDAGVKSDATPVERNGSDVPSAVALGVLTDFGSPPNHLLCVD